ncbi:hypothetical protein K431DRAFT_56660 [Polychaeton citri CBS 116435]|uniref:Secreted protein n=1 Tax=Polychaeton citri CBS 116435 TaxID=1314669 RepID=A0A9P4URT9_9PEZI|nr:hypothetical protein K431DRAFT_56660 [Polychaeton citri CBS 116435]
MRGSNRLAGSILHPALAMLLVGYSSISAGNRRQFGADISLSLPFASGRQRLQVAEEGPSKRNQPRALDDSLALLPSS